MRIRIKDIGVTTEKEIHMYLSDDYLDGNEYVDLIIEDDEYNIDIDELFLAVKAFKERRDMNLKRNMILAKGK